MMKRVTFYIDGFNFYYGLKTIKKINPDWRQAYWIDLVKLFSQFLGENQTIEKVIYFTASPLNKEKSSRQSAFLNANKLINKDKFEVIRGKYLTKNIICPNCKISIARPEEKKTDVNISVRMLTDCIEDKTDKIVLVSGDTDLLPPLEYILKNYKDKEVSVYFPPIIHSNNISNIMKYHKSKTIYLERNFPKFINSKMQECVSIDNKTFTMPSKWK